MLKIAGFLIFAVVLVFFLTACEPGASSGGLSVVGTGGGGPGAYMASDVRIVGLTEITEVSSGQWQGRLNAYVDLLDDFGCRVRSPGVFRFELYEFVPRSSEPKGKRILIWPDIDLTDATTNNSYWRDFLRAYHFDMDINFSPRPGESFVLEVTFTTPDGRRLRDIFQLRQDRQ